MVKLILSSFRRQRGIYLLWLLSLSAAVSGLMTVDVFRHSLTQTLQDQGRSILAADVTLSSRQGLSDDQIASLKQTLPESAEYARMVEMFAMVSAGAESRLAMLRFISDEFPLLGDLQVRHEAVPVPARGEDLATAPLAWVASDVLALMNLNIGDELKVGEITVRIHGVVEKDSSLTFRFGNMAPRIYLHRNLLPKTKLVQFGSTYSDTYMAALPVPAERGLKPKLERLFQQDSSLRITVPTDLEQGSLRLLSQLLDYLGLTGLVTLSLGWIGVYYLGRRWLAMEALSSGILKCLGFSSRELFRLLTLKLLLILSLGVLIGGGVAWAGAHALLPFVRDSLPAEFELVWSWKNSILMMVIGPMAGFLLLYRSMAALAAERPLHLFQERVDARASLRSLLLLIVTVAGLFVLLTFFQARSWRVTGTFLGSLAVSVVLIAALAFGFLKLVQRLRSRKAAWITHLVTALWTKRLATSMLLICVSALAGLLSQLIPHLEKTLVGELKTPQQTERPALFMVDVQEEQLQPLQKFLQHNGIEVSTYSPFIRARIASVNGVEFERARLDDWSTREEETEARFRNRGVNLTYRTELSKSETIIRGKNWSELSRDPAEISVEERYADRLNLKIGDVLRFDVQGIELEATIANLRKINWNSFEPNFFVQFPDGVLNDAPKTWVMTVKRHPTLLPTQIQSLVTKDFPNVTSINVETALDGVTELIGQLSSGLSMASRLSLGLGIFVFLMILLFQLLSARQDWRQLLLLGLTSRQIWLLQVIAYGGLCLVGTLIGALLSVTTAWGLFHFGFDSRVEFDFPGMFKIWLLTWSLAVLGLAILGGREIRLARRQSMSSE